jgi:hypothetical protein
VELCTYHKIPKATITIACDNILALQNSLDPNFITMIYDPDYDLIIAVKKKMKETCITWQYHHVHGQQDETKDLDHCEQLHIEMDSLAKHALSQPYQPPT